MAPDARAVDAILAYHTCTKHHLNRYAASPGYLDWATQPDPFRTFIGADKEDLPLPADRLATTFSALYCPSTIPPVPLDRMGVAILLELSLGLSAWKQYAGHRWALRCNPSSGNLHPTEGYAILPDIPGLNAGVYHYVSRDHALERRCALEGGAVLQLAKALPPSSCLVGLSSIHWREAWKYGERAFRYCQHDAGHAIAAVRYAAAALGWSVRLLGEASDPTLVGLLGLTRPECVSDIAEADREYPDALLLIEAFPRSPRGVDTARVDLPTLHELLQAGTWMGQANPLSPAHLSWPAIDAACKASWRAEGERASCWQPDATSICRTAEGSAPPDAPSDPSAVQLIKQRRSCLALDGTTEVEAATFYAILDRLLPRPGVPPWDVWPYPAHLHCAIFVHRVRGVPPGLYFLERNPAARTRLRAALAADFAWTRPPGCPESLPLFALAAGEFQERAELVSCHQQIAGSGAFSLGMIADFGDSIRAVGAWWYRRLFWESGLLGHVLYLEAEAAGLRGTGIGCFFDDAFHDVLGLGDDHWQSLYHFTVGGPIDDPRLMTLPPYFHLDIPRRITG